MSTQQDNTSRPGANLGANIPSGEPTTAISNRRAAPSSQRRGGGTDWLKTLAQPLVAIILLVIVWSGSVALFNIPTYVVPTPVQVLRSFRDDFGILLDNLAPTLIEAVSGFAIGNAVAIFLAILFVHNRSMERTLFPLAVLLKTIPVVALAPVLVLMLGNGYAPKIIIASLISFFPGLVNLVKGFQAVSSQQVELFRILSATKTEVFFKLRVFTALPYFFSALKITAPTAVIGAIVAEWIGSEKGVGALIVSTTYNFQTPLLYAAMIEASLIAMFLIALVSGSERLTKRWNVGDGAITNM